MVIRQHHNFGAMASAASTEVRTGTTSKSTRSAQALCQNGHRLAFAADAGDSRRCHELRVRDRAANWRIIYRTDGEAILIGEVFAKKTQTTPRDVIATCQKRFREYDDACR